MYHYSYNCITAVKSDVALVGGNDLKLIKSESIEKESDSNFANNIDISSKDNNSASIHRFFYSNKNSTTEEASTATTTTATMKKDDLKSISKKNKRWNLVQAATEVENENIITKKYYSSIVDNKNVDLKINVNDFIIFNSDKFTNSSNKLIQANNELIINESSNTNYSADDDEDDTDNDSSICFGQVHSIWLDSSNNNNNTNDDDDEDMPMLKIKVF